MGPSVWLIAGPTASGKSALALRLAETHGGEIVNADSMQLYADLRVLTARPDPADLARATHHLDGVADAADGWSAGRWLEAAEATLQGIAERGRPAIVVGGTGLYIRALTVGLADVPPVPLALRDALTAQYASGGEGAMRAALREHDLAAEARIQPGDRQRLVRALGVAQATGASLSSWQARTVPALQPGAWAGVVLEPPRDVLYACCDARLAAMANGGALAEVEALRARRLDPALPVTKALGVRAFTAVLDGETDLATALAVARQETRRFAKRQTTWFRNQTPDWPRIAETEPQAQWRALQRLVETASA